MTVTMEKIDELKSRRNVSYSEAKKALERNNGDLVGAMIFLEAQGENNSQQKRKDY